MSFIGFVLAAVGVALSACYSGILALILENGADIAWLKNYSALEPQVLCALCAGVLAVLGALILLGKKKFSALMLFAAAGIQAYVEFGLGLTYPYLTASIGLFAVAGLCGCLIGSRSVAEDEADEDEPEEALAKAPVPEPEPESVVDAAPKPADIPAPENEGAEEAPKAPAPAKRIWGIVLAAAGAAVSLFLSGAWNIIAEIGTDLERLKEFSPFEPLHLCVIGAAVLAVLAILFHLGRKKFAALLLIAAAGILAYAQYGLEIEYPYWYAGIALYAAAALRALCVEGSAAAGGARRYTWAYVFAFILAVGASVLALRGSGLEPQICSAGSVQALIDSLMAADCQTRAVALIAAFGALGGVLTLLFVPFAALLILFAMFGSLAAEMLLPSFYPNSWVALLLFALATLLGFSVRRSGEPSSVKRLTFSAAAVLMLIAAVAGGAGMWRVSQGALEAKLANARDNDPAYKQIAEDVKAKDARIAEMESQIAAQAALIAERDQNISGMASQAETKDGEIRSLNALTAERDAQIAALQSQADALKAQLSDSHAALNRRFAFFKGSNNVRNVAHSRAGSKVISRLTDEVVEVLDVQRPEGSSADWYQVKGSFGTGWAFGKNAVLFDLK